MKIGETESKASRYHGEGKERRDKDSNCSIEKSHKKIFVFVVCVDINLEIFM
jgi:hypothetical protein